MSEPTDIERLVFRPVDASRWADMERLFEGPGGPKYCWCMAWRATPKEAQHHDNASRKEAMFRRVHAGVPVGLLGYLEGEPVAWCSVAPRPTYRRLVKDDNPDPEIWSIVCFFVVRRLRGQGITHRLIQAAVDHARANGASIVEAYPVDVASPSYRHMGFVPALRHSRWSSIQHSRCDPLPRSGPHGRRSPK